MSLVKLPSGVDILTRPRFREAAGDRTTFIFLHYWGGSSRTWSEVVDLIMARNPSFDCLSFDARGWGHSSKDANLELDLESMATDVGDLVRHFGIQSYILVGHSMGGKVAMLHASRQASQALKGVALVASATPGPQPMPVEENEMLSNLYDHLEQAVPSILERLVRKPLTEEQKQRVTEDTTSGTRQSWEIWPRVNMKRDIRSLQEGAGKWTVDKPTIIIASHDDPIDPVKSAVEHIVPHLSALSSLVELHGPGHLLPLEASEDIAEQLIAFASSLDCHSTSA